MMRQQLQLLQRSSFYLELDDTVWPLLEQQRLQEALRKARAHVRLLLDLLDLLLEEIVLSRQDLQNFLLQSEQGQVDTCLLTDTLSTVRQVHEYLKDFDIRPTRNMGPLDLDIRLPNAGPNRYPPVTAMLDHKLPVFFDNLQLHAKSTTVTLAWANAGGLPGDPNEFFEVQTKVLHPTVGEHGWDSKCAILGMSCVLDGLTPDRLYQFSIKRLDRINLVYAEFIDTCILKTLAEDPAV
uniref:DUF5581 domain-containing protein n=1 Tax=Neogobius melanostomus TaxID=47308 RepID=A0A8C6U8S3_9GOBI